MKSSLKNNLLFLLLVLASMTSNSTETNKQKLTFDLNNTTTLNYLINNQVKEQYPFYGLATYLNQVQYYLVDKDTIHDLDRNNQDSISLNNQQWLAIAGRFNVLLVKADAAEISFDENQQLSFQKVKPDAQSFLVKKDDLKDFAQELDQIRYNHLWAPFAFIAKLIESLLVFIQAGTTLSWGLSIVIFSLIIKLMMLPVSLMTSKSQEKTSKITSQLQPQLKAIKSKYDGEIAHNKIMQAHKDLGVSPFYTLKPMMSFLIQIPILIAVFNALGEMPQLLNQSFLWFDDLSKPDSWLALNLQVPLLGTDLNLMPIIMTIITLLSTVFHTDKHASQVDNKKQKLKLYLMAAGFLVLFYPFPVAMVMYWALANLWQFVQQKLFKN
jgi:YidC/Oxa1 family membrane protein insertase